MVVREYTKGEPIKCGTEIKKHGMSIFIASPRIHFTSEEPHMFLLDGMKNHDDEDDAWQHFLDEELDSYYRE
ncbi:MAG: hypothetical protein GY829_00850 [Gammaproteobacteria bacterium]|nr:hypothetical protein [Gammaproteobacteria bacterium]